MQFIDSTPRLHSRGTTMTFSQPTYPDRDSRWLAPVVPPADVQSDTASEAEFLAAVDRIAAEKRSSRLDEPSGYERLMADLAADTPAGLNEFSPAVPLAKDDDGVRGGQGNTAADVRKAVGVDEPQGDPIVGLGNVVKLYAIVAGAAVAAWWIGAPVLASVGIGALAGGAAVAFVAAGR